MATKYLRHFPKPLLDDLVGGRWLPIIGAGFSRNAVVPAGKQMPLWADLGSSFATEIGDYASAGALDAISAYEHEYGRPKLIERLAEALLISESRPGTAHQAFCSIPFDIVCTTNFDFLLERQYEAVPRNCTPVVDEEQLSINVRDSGVGLLKLHGDLRHPVRLVATETDYDRFLDKYPMLATYLANLLITRTAVFIGYSLDDPDFCQVWQVVGERLGRSRRMAYAISVGAKSTDISRFDRRGVKIINLPAVKSKYGGVLAEAFDELRDYWRAALIPSSQVKEEQSRRELSLPAKALTRLCFFAVPLALLSFYRDRIFPLVRQNGFVPVTADEVVAPGDAILPKIDALIGRARLMVVDASTDFTLEELRIGIRQLHDPTRILIIYQEGTTPPDIMLQSLARPDVTVDDPEPFLNQVQDWLHSAAERLRPDLLGEPTRLLHAGEYRAAVMSAISLLESVLRRHADRPGVSSPRYVTLRPLLEQANSQGMLGDTPVHVVQEWLKVRNEVVHSHRPVTKANAEQIVNGV
jgi:SIR2-like protein